MDRTCIGVIPYLNALPLVADLPRDLPGVEIVEGLPSTLARQLRGGEIDVGLVPQVEACVLPDYRIVPGPCIACDGPVRSILLFRRVPWTEVRRIAVDRSSNSSVELLKVLRRIDDLPDSPVESVPPDLGRLEGSDPFDAVLLIGDPALAAARSSWERDDLGELWKERTGLPFVFAAWVGRQGLSSRARQLLEEAWRNGTAKKNDLACQFVDENPGIL